MIRATARQTNLHTCMAVCLLKEVENEAGDGATHCVAS